MAIINDEVRRKTEEARVEVFFVPRQATKWWNSQRTDKATEIALLGGYYWSDGRDEAGPFRTPSAAWRDAYYRRVLDQSPPLMSHADLDKALTEINELERKQRRRKTTGQVRDGRVYLPDQRGA